MKIQFKGKMVMIERASTDAVTIKLARTHGKVIEGAESLAPSAKEAEMSMEFALRPALIDKIPIGQSLVITIATVADDDT